MTNDKTSEAIQSDQGAWNVGESVIRLIREHYSLNALRIHRIYAGLGSRNWIVDTPQMSYFVKEFMSGEDALKGKRSIDVGSHCISCGIASPSTIANRAGEHLTPLAGC